MSDSNDDPKRGIGITGRIESVLPSFVRRSYAAKFMVTLLLVVALIGAIGAYIHFNTQAHVSADTQEEITGIAREEASGLQNWVDSRRSNTKFLAASLPADANRSVLQADLERKLVQLPTDVQGLHVVDTDAGEVISSTKGPVSGASLGSVDAPWAQNPDAVPGGSVTISDPYSSGQDSLVAFSTRLSADRTVVLTTSLSSRSKGFNSPIATGDIKVVNAEGTIVFDNRNAHLLDSYTDDGSVPQVVSAGLNGSTGFVQTEGGGAIESGDYVMAYTPVFGTDWVLLIHVPAAEAFALQSQITQNLGILVLVALVGLALVALTIGRNTAKRLSELSETANGLAEGQLDASIPESRRVDELGSLVDSFGKLHSYLNTVADRAEALAEQDFEAEVLEEDVPGAFGETLDRMGTDLEEMVTNVEEARTEAEAARQEAEALNESLEEKAVEFGEVMDSAAAGDLTVRMDPESPSEEMERIARSFNEMLEDLEHTISQVKAIARDVDTSIAEVEAGAAEISDASQEVTESIQDISAGLDEHDDSVQEIAGEMSNLSATVEEVASSAEEVAKTTESAAERGRDGREAADEAINEMERIKEQSLKTAEEIETLESEMEEIDEIVEMIEEIAGQTNMLALNANIEAAREDKDGEGFAVVANEVKQLAGEVGEATNTVSAHIEEVRETTDEAVGDMRQMRNHVMDGTETIEATLETLEEVVVDIEEANTGVQSIDDATDEQAASAEEVATMADEIADISEETSGEADDVAAAAEEQTAAIQSVTANTEDLSSEAETLDSLIDQFEVEG